uniref:Uncharacterized protein n=1 Tax=Anguilla anguilla TaxID=7936 RepID=A0A0E9S1T9_ANGAN
MQGNVCTQFLNNNYMCTFIHHTPFIPYFALKRIPGSNVKLSLSHSCKNTQQIQDNNAVKKL